MNTGKDYASMIRDQYGSVRILPVSAGWEFMPRPVQYTVPEEMAEVYELAQRNQWLLSAELRQAFTGSKQAVVVTDQRQTIQYVNELFVSMSGYKPREVIGRHPKFLQGSDTDIRTRQRIKSALLHEQSIHEVLLNYRKDGTPYWCDLSIFPVFNHQRDLINFIAFEQETTR